MVFERLSRMEGLTPTERKIASVITRYPQFVIDLPLEKLARRACASEASVIRLCKKLGTRGFADFKIRLAREIDEFGSANASISVDIPISSSDDVSVVAQSMYDLSSRSLKLTRRELDVALVRRAALLLHQSSLVHVYGRGESLVLAEDFHYKLLRIGVRSTLNAENGFQEAESLDGAGRGHMRECALVISQYCDSHHVNYIVDELRECRVPFILLTSSPKAWPYDRYAYVTLRYPSTESRHKMGSFASRTSAFYVLDCLFGCLFSLDYERRSKELASSSARKARREYFYRTSQDLPD